MGLKVDLDVGAQIIVGDVVITCVHKRGNRSRLDVFAPKKTRIVTGPSQEEVDNKIKAAK